MTEAKPLVRQWTILRTLCARHHGITVKELATEMAVDTKTIRRDLEAFRTAGFPLLETIGQFGRKSYRLDPQKSRPGMSFAFDEAIALYLGRCFLEPLAGTLFWDAAQRAFKKIRSTLGAETLKYIDQFATVFYQTTIGASDYSQKADLIDSLVQAIEERRVAFITYRSLRATESVTYDVYPFGLIYHRGSLYLVGHAVQHDSLRHWKVDRIEAVNVEELRFERPVDFDLSSHFLKSFGVYQGNGEVHVKVRFSQNVARYVEESQWHASQKLTWEKDGSLLADFDLDGTEEIMRWIMSFGRHAEVVEPEEFRRKIAVELFEMASLYNHNRIQRSFTG